LLVYDYKPLIALAMDIIIR